MIYLIWYQRFSIGSANDREESSDGESEEGKPALWVERYAPRRYTELLSDEVNVPICMQFYVCLSNLILCVAKG